jgi:hypothetical protein
MDMQAGTYVHAPVRVQAHTQNLCVCVRTHIGVLQKLRDSGSNCQVQTVEWLSLRHAVYVYRVVHKPLDARRKWKMQSQVAFAP